MFLLNAWHTTSTTLNFSFHRWDPEGLCTWRGRRPASQRLQSAAHNSQSHSSCGTNTPSTSWLLIICATYSPPPPLLVKTPSLFFPQQILKCWECLTIGPLLTPYPLSGLHFHQELNTFHILKTSLKLFSLFPTYISKSLPSVYTLMSHQYFKLSTFKVENILMPKSVFFLYLLPEWTTI